MFEVLGPLRVHAGPGTVTPAGRQAVLLGVLIARANTPVTVEELTGALGGDPASLVARLPEPLAARVVAVDGGYLLRVEPGELDADRFTDLLTAGQLTAALALWRGDAYQDLGVPLLAGEVTRLTVLRLAATEDRLDDVLADPAVLPELVEHVRAHPLRERAQLLYVTALYRAGRLADALAAYRSARDLSVAELGVEPGFELRALEARILAGEPTSPARGPAQLPAPAQPFVGRAAALAAIDDSRGTGAVVLTGPPGVGTTALAVRWAHDNRADFPDGQLYVDLHGFGPGPSAAPEDVLAGFLRALGTSVPADPVERAVRFRALLRGRRVLVVLDNASSATQVRPLLPGGATSFVLVTSRDPLTALGVAEVDLGPLPPEEARDLVVALTGAERAGLVAGQSWLPLDLRVTVAAGTPDFYGRLDRAAARLFRLMGRHPWDAPADALAALAGHDVRAPLATLVAAQLVEERRGGRYGMHDVLREYAAALPDREPGACRRLFAWYVRAAAAAREAVLPGAPPLPMSGVPAFAVRFADRAAARAWFETERPALVALATSGESDDLAWRLAGLVQPFFETGKLWEDWLTTHRAALAAARRTRDPLAEATVLYGIGAAYDAIGDQDAAMRSYDRAATLFHRAGESHLATWNLANLGAVYAKLGHLAEAVDMHRAALGRFRALGDRRGIASSLDCLGDVYCQQGRYDAAERALVEALSIPEGPRSTYAHLAELCRTTDRPAEARGWYEQGVDDCLTDGDRWQAATLLTRLAALHDDPAPYLREARALFEEVGDVWAAVEVAGMLALS